MKQHPLGLTAWLTIVTVLLVTFAVAALSLAAIGSLRDLAEAEGLTRVELAASAAREGLRQSIEDVLTDARVLAERPTLRGLLAEASVDLIEPYLSQYCEAAYLDSCAIFQMAAPLVVVGQFFPYAQLDLSQHLAEGLVVASPNDDNLLYGGSAEVPDVPETRVIAIRRIDDTFADRLSERAGMDIRVTSSMRTEASSEIGALDAEALRSRSVSKGLVPPIDSYVAVLPVATASDGISILLRAFLPAQDVMEPVQALTQRMLMIATLVATLAAVSGIVIGRFWIGGISRLTETAHRIGSGELSAAVPAERGRELNILAATMEKMRVNLLELEAARRTRDTVLANISHEFRTPLSAQLASIELLKDGLESMPKKQQHQLVASLERGAQRLTRLIDNLLESVRIESGQLAIRHQELDMSEVVHASLDLIEPLIRQRQQRIEVDLHDLPPITGDRQRLIQVFVNLLANANKFAPPDTAIRIGAEQRAGMVYIWVEDEGPSPLADSNAVLFEQFRRGTEGDRDEGGLGLGLYIVRSIVERHGGRVSLFRTGERTRAQVELRGEVLE